MRILRADTGQSEAGDGTPVDRSVVHQSRWSSGAINLSFVHASHRATGGAGGQACCTVADVSEPGMADGSEFRGVGITYNVRHICPCWEFHCFSSVHDRHHIRRAPPLLACFASVLSLFLAIKQKIPVLTYTTSLRLATEHGARYARVPFLARLVRPRQWTSPWSYIQTNYHRSEEEQQGTGEGTR